MLARRILEFFVSQSFVFSPEWNGYRPSATRLAQKLPFFVSTSVEGKGTPLPFGVPPPIIWLHFLLPLPMSGDPRSLKCEHLCDPHSFLTVTFWLLDNFSSTGGEYHSHLLVSVSHHVTPPSLREERGRNRNIIEKKKANQFTVLSPFLSFFFSHFTFLSSPFFFTLWRILSFSFFSSLLIFTIGENNFTSLFFSLSLPFLFLKSCFPFFLFLSRLLAVSYFKPWGGKPFFLSFFLRHFWRLYKLGY